MEVRIHPHTQERMGERGASEDEITEAIMEGEKFPAKFGRTGFRRNYVFDREWKGRRYLIKQLEVFAVEEKGGWLAVTVIVKYF